jgi:uncharacterized protein YjeT (DUF2065 family)
VSAKVRLQGAVADLDLTRTELFQSRSDAAWHLVGLGGFWAGWAAVVLVWLVRAPGVLVLGGLSILVIGVVASMKSTRKLEERMTGRHVRPWPFGYPRMRTQIATMLPSTVNAAARRLGLNAMLVDVVIYGLLGADLVLLVAMFSLLR